jgi:hypothetical protein
MVSLFYLEFELQGRCCWGGLSVTKDVPEGGIAVGVPGEAAENASGALLPKPLARR